MMKNNAYILLIILFSCASPKLTNNDRGCYGYAKLINPEEILDVTVSTLPLPDVPKKTPEKLKTFFDLRDSIPHVYLRMIASKVSTSDAIIKAIKTPLSDADPSPAQATINLIKSNEFKVRLIFTNTKKYYRKKEFMHPNTRLEFLTTTLKSNSNNFAIVSIDRIENEFETIDMGTLDRTQNVSFNSKLSLEGNLGATGETTNSNTNGAVVGTEGSDIKTAYDENGKPVGVYSTKNATNSSDTKTSSSKANATSAVGAKGELQYANTEAIKEAINVKFKRIKTGFSFSPKSITISQRSMPLTDISDNIVVTATIKMNKTSTQMDNKIIKKFTDLFDANGAPNSVDKIKMADVKVAYSPCSTSEDIKFTVDYEGAVRSVKNLQRGRNILEFDDKVKYFWFERNNVPSNEIIIPKVEFCHDVYKVVATFKNDPAEYVLNLESATADEILLYDEHYPEQISAWIIQLIQSGDLNTFKKAVKFSFIDNKGNIVPLSAPGFTANDLSKLKTLETIGFKIR